MLSHNNICTWFSEQHCSVSLYFAVYFINEKKNKVSKVSFSAILFYILVFVIFFVGVIMGVFVCPFTQRMCVCQNVYVCAYVRVPVCACACMCRDMISVLCIDKLSAFSRVSLRLDKLPVLSANALRQDRAVSFAIQFFPYSSFFCLCFNV